MLIFRLNFLRILCPYYSVLLNYPNKCLLKKSKKHYPHANLRRDGKGWLLMNKLMEYHYSQKELHVEDLVTMIPSKVCSRATLLSYITGCVVRKVLTKTSSPHDKRIKIVKPTPQFVDEFERWTEEFYSDDNWEMKTDYKKL